MDDQLSHLERQWRGSGTLEDEVALLTAKLRCGLLPQERLEFAASLDHGAACAALGRRARKTQHGALRRWFLTLWERGGDLWAARAALAVARLVVDLACARYDLGSSPYRETLDASHAYLDADGERRAAPSASLDQRLRAAPPLGTLRRPDQRPYLLLSYGPADALDWITMTAATATSSVTSSAPSSSQVRDQAQQAVELGAVVLCTIREELLVETRLAEHPRPGSHEALALLNDLRAGPPTNATVTTMHGDADVRVARRWISRTLAPWLLHGAPASHGI